MLRQESGLTEAAPPSFLAARNRRQKARAAGLSPDHWYPVAESSKLERGRVVGTRFWGRPVAVYRDVHGRVHALEDRCAHRQVKLSLGEVKGCSLVCMHHGWEYDKDGKVVAIPHETHGKQVANLRIAAFPVQERYGLAWIFPGNPSLSNVRKLPEIPELEGKARWSTSRVDFVCKAHHSMIVESLCDFSRAHPHRKHRPFRDAMQVRCEAAGDKVHVSYNVRLGGGALVRSLIADSANEQSHVELCYEYPYQSSNLDDSIKYHCFVTPLDAQTTHVFFVLYCKAQTMSGLARSLPSSVTEPLLKVANQLLITPLLREDAVACEAEQEGYNRFFDAPVAELNPLVNLLQQLTIRKWEEHLAAKDTIPLSRVSP